MKKTQQFNHAINQQRDTPVQAVEQMINTALQLHQQGQLQQAEQVYREILRQQPKFAYAMNLLGVLLSQKKNHDEGARLLQKAIKIEPDVAGYHINLGFNLQEQGKLELAEKEYAKATRLDTDSADAWFNLGNVGLALKKQRQAIHAFRKTIELNRNHQPALNNLGNLYREMGMVDEALIMLKRVLEINPDMPKSWYNLGMVYRDMGDGENAVMCLEKVTMLEPANFKARIQLADCRGLLLNDIEGAFKDYDAVIASTPDYAPAQIQKAYTLLTLGRHEEAEKFYRKAIEIDETATIAYGGLVSSNLYTEQDINKMLALLDNKNLDTKNLVDLHFFLGIVFDKNKQYEKAFKHFQQGNRLHRGTYEYNVENFEKHVSQQICMFDESYMANHADHGVDSDLPVFIVGMPRSGTTLVEQILASHPDVHGAGELPYITNISRRLWVLCHGRDALLADNTPASNLPAEVIQAQAEAYLHQITKTCQSVSRITDKTTLNFLYLGFIAMLFPQARIIHCQRNPLDTCLSMYMLKFMQPQLYAYDLQELGVCYRQYQRLMSHWQSLLGGRVLNIHYEELISDLEGNSRKLIDYMGLPWDERCLRFHETKRSVQTASHLQVRQNVYTTSRERWRNYEAWLGPLRAALDETR